MPIERKTGVVYREVGVALNIFAHAMHTPNPPFSISGSAPDDQVADQQVTEKKTKHAVLNIREGLYIT